VTLAIGDGVAFIGDASACVSALGIAPEPSATERFGFPPQLSAQLGKIITDSAANNNIIRLDKERVLVPKRRGLYTDFHAVSSTSAMPSTTRAVQVLGDPENEPGRARLKTDHAAKSSHSSAIGRGARDAARSSRDP